MLGLEQSGTGFILFKESKIEWKGLGPRNYLFRNPTNADYGCLTIFFIPSSSCMCMGMPSAICQVPLRRSKGSVVELVLSPTTVWLLGVEFRLALTAPSPGPAVPFLMSWVLPGFRQVFPSFHTENRETLALSVLIIWPLSQY